MKIIFFMSCFLINTFTTHCQTVTAELTIRYLNDRASYANEIYALDSVPFLEISYKNNSKDSIYFLKLINNVNGLPHFFQSMLGISFDPESYLQDVKFYNHSGHKFRVNIYGQNYYNGIWQIFSTYPKNHKSRLNGLLMDYYTAYSSVIMNDTIHERFYFDTNINAPKHQKNSISNGLIFLTSGESYKEYYNLLGFYLLQGEYTFSIDAKKFENYVYVEEEIPEKYSEKKLYLPDKFNGYNLYQDSIRVEDTCVTF